MNIMNLCPWNNYTRATVNFCEAQLCSWVESPGIAWAGISYIIAGIFLFKKIKKNDHWILKSFPWFAISMGTSSAIYHSSHIFVFQAWDVISMFMLGSALLVLNFKRMNWPSNKSIYFSILTLSSFCFLFFKGKSGGIILGILILLFLISEYLLRKTRKRWKDLWISLSLFGLGIIALWFEHRSGLCNPDNHFFQWHAVWDNLCAITYVTLFKHFKTIN